MINSLKFRVVVIVGFASMIAGAVAILFFTQSFNRQLDSLDDRTLRGQLDDIVRYLSVVNDDTKLELPNTLLEQYLYSGGQFVYAINSRNEFLLGSPTVNNKLVPESLNFKGTNEFFTYYREMYGADHIFQGVQKWITIDNRLINIQVAQGPAHKDVMYDEIIDELFEQRQEILIIFIITVLLTAYLVISISFRSLERIISSSKNIDFKKLSSRLTAKRIPTELRELIHKFNEALAKIENDYKEQKFFLDTVSHEIRNPLASLKMSLSGNPDDLDVSLISQEVEKLHSITSELFELSRIENASIENFTNLALEDATRSAIVSFINTHDLEDIEVKFDALHPTPTNIFCNQVLIDILMTNLIENSIKAIQAKAIEGKKLIEVSINHNRLTVKDFGIGIGNNDFNSLLSDRSENNFKTGLKLGLVIIKKICELCEAEVTAETIDQETFFHITFKV